MKIIKFDTSHLNLIELQPNQIHVYEYLKPEDYKTLTGWTILDNENRVVMCTGLVKIFAHRFVGWSLIAHHAGKHLRKIIKLIRRYFRMKYKGCRIECTCDVRFDNAHQLVKLLGFTCEAPLLRMHEIDKRNVSLYAIFP